MSVDSLAHKKAKLFRRKRRTRSGAYGKTGRPRLSVHISHRHVSAQIIDDQTGKTLVYATTQGSNISGSLTDKAAKVGEEIAKKSQKANIKQVVYDRGARKYHGRVKSLADAARAGGLEF